MFRTTQVDDMKALLIIFLILTYVSRADGAERTLKADFRHRPPEMVVSHANHSRPSHNTVSGPLKDIIEEAAQNIGFSIEWRFAPFARSLADLGRGNIDLLPRVIKTQNRSEFVEFVGPISYQEKNIVFLVRPGYESSIKNYTDLYKLPIAVKIGTTYFSQFDNDHKIKKIPLQDDKQIARMFVGGRINIMAILDKIAIETAFNDINFYNYSYSEFQHKQRIANYYGLSKKSLHKSVYPKLNKELRVMAQSGRIKEIYRNYQLEELLL